MYKIFKKYFIFFTPIILLLLFIFSLTGNNYYIGGDLIFPLKPENNILRSLYLWEEQNGGFSFFKYMLLLWQAIFYFFSVLNIPSYLSIKLFIIILYVLGFLSAFFSYKILFKKTKYSDSKLAFLATIIFFLNPVGILVLVGSVPLYGFPLCFLFILKFLESKNIFYALPFAFFFNLAFFPDLPQAKFLTVFIFSTFFLIWLFCMVQRIRLKTIILPILRLILIAILLNAFVIIPFLSDAFGEKGVYQNFTREVGVYEGNADLYSASLPYISRFYNSNLIDGKSKLGQFLTNPIFILWTFLIWIILLLGMILVKDRKDKRIMFILIIGIFSIIFIAKGANPPFGEIYRFLLSNIPAFKIFRTTAALAIGAVLFYAILVTMAFHVLSEHLSPKWKGIFYLAFIIINVLVFHPIYLGYKLYNRGEGGLYERGVSIPKEYFQMGEQLDNVKEDIKVLSLPLDDGYVNKDWGYFGQSLISWITKKPFLHSHPSSFDVDITTSSQACLLTSLYNVGYVLQEKDTADKNSLRDSIFPSKTTVENKYFSLKKTDDSCIWPHVYIPDNLVYLNGNSKEIINLADLPNLKWPLLIYQAINRENLSSVEVSQNNFILDKANKVILNIKPETIYPEQDDKNIRQIKLDLNKQDIAEVFYPYVRVRPDSIFYSLVLLKENSKEKKQRNRPLLDGKLFFASKRISEVKKWGINNNWWEPTFQRYAEKMTEAIETAGKTDNPRENLQIVLGFKNAHQRQIEKLIKDEGWSLKITEKWEETFKNLQKEIDKVYSPPEFNKFQYSFKAPIAGDYNLFLTNKTSFSGLESLEINLNTDKSASLSANPQNIIGFGKHPLEITDNQLLVTVRGVNLINSKFWIEYERNASFKKQGETISFSDRRQIEPRLPLNVPVLFQDIKGWEAGAKYLLRIKYKTRGGASLGVFLQEKKEIYDLQMETWIDKEMTIVNEEIGDSEEFTDIITADQHSLGAKIYLYGVNGIADISKIEMTKLVIPTVILEKEKGEQETSLPQLVFSKINSTKYKIQIARVQNPYFLVFSESFDKGWKVYINQSQDPISEMTATYLSDKIKEGEHQNIFLNQDTFETLKEKPIAEERHYPVNGYANAWLILPEDADGADNYEIVLEYSPQRLLYIGGAISLLTVIGIIFLTLVRKRYEKTKKH